MRDPRCKHEYLDRVKSSLTVTENGDERDKYVEARDRRYSRLIYILHFKKVKKPSIFEFLRKISH